MINFLLRLMGKTLLWLRYRIKVSGVKEVAARGRSGILFLPNHPALIDPIIVQAHLMKHFHPRSLADRDQIDRFFVRYLAKRVGALEIPDLARHGANSREQVTKAVDMCIESLRAGDNLILYPAGHLYFSRYEDLRGNSAVETILEKLPDVRIVLVRTTGLWGSGFSWAGGHNPSVADTMKKGLIAILKNALFFTPRRNVTVELYESDDLPRTAKREAINDYLEEFYNQKAPPNTYVPYTIWESGGLRELPEPQLGIGGGHVESVPDTTRQIVTEYLRDLTGRSEIDDSDHLARDMGLDSLARAELIVYLEKEFGFPTGDVDALQTVADVMLAACGQSISGHIAEMKPIPKQWFTSDGIELEQQEIAGKTVTEAFLYRASQTPDKVIIADQSSGVRTYRDILTGIFALKDHISALEGQNVGIMLPASVAADVVYMATLFAGKTPVMVNWTVGRRNMVHSLDLVGVKNVLTAEALVGRLAAQGVDFATLDERFVFLEKIGRQMSRMDKLSAWFKGRFMPSILRKIDIAPAATAVILFTSGSESLPKAVPLTHENLHTNVHDIATLIPVNDDDHMISILPPFHSYGLTVGVFLPLCAGISVVYHPNPTEAPMLARIIEAYKATILIATPTFLAGIVRSAAGEQLDSLRLAVTGGEKCPQRLYDAIASCCPDAVVAEGYGVTECSPIISANDPADARHGTIGKILPSLQYAIIDVDTSQRVKPGDSGMLLVRGNSVFEGYIHYDGPSPFIEFEGTHWYRTGDLVCEDSDGILTFAGRLKRFVKLGGEMISLPAVESVLLQHYAHDDDEGPPLAVEATPNEDHPELVLFTTGDLDRETVNNQIRSAGLSALHNIRQIIPIKEIPLLGTGKTDYRTLKEKL